MRLAPFFIVAFAAGGRTQTDELTARLEALTAELSELKQQVRTLTADAQSGRRLTSSSTGRASITYDGEQVSIGSSVRIAGNLTVDGATASGGCFRRWGVWGCPQSGMFDAVVKGYGGGMELYSNADTSGVQISSVECVDADATSLTDYGEAYYYHRLSHSPTDS